MEKQRIAEVSRQTAETAIELRLNLDGGGDALIDTGIPFLDHMLVLFARHGCFDLQVKASGDLEVDYHHLVEDLGIVLGQAINEALGERRGIVRYGFFLLPMDETLVRVAIDLSNRAYLVYNVSPGARFVRDFNVSLLREFFQGLVNQAGMNLHFQLEYGDEPHHAAEAVFKGFARALDQASAFDPRIGDRLPSTKESL
jgi:imidazoleglycerol-phosphate dehydratase